MQYIIMCGGTYKNWPVPKQLQYIKGERIVERTIRLLREAGVEDIAISSHNPIFKEFGVPVLRHVNRFTVSQDGSVDGTWVDGLYPTDYPVCYILGDVYFSPEAIKTIVNTETEDIEFFASSPPFSKYCTKDHAEPFALKVVNTQHLKEAIQKLKRLDMAGQFNRPPIAWELWQVIKDTPLNKIDYHNYVEINDYTNDIDLPEDVCCIEDIVRGLP